MVPQRRSAPRAPRICFFCKEGLTPTFKDNSTLERFLTDRGKIVGKIRSGVCAKHQRLLTQEVKRARYLAIIPFVQVV